MNDQGVPVKVFEAGAGSRARASRFARELSKTESYVVLQILPDGNGMIVWKNNVLYCDGRHRIQFEDGVMKRGSR